MGLGDKEYLSAELLFKLRSARKRVVVALGRTVSTKELKREVSNLKALKTDQQMEHSD